jgi:tetratricopeptide (TPR) repeat protein
VWPRVKEHACELAYHFGKAQEFAKAVHYHMEAGRYCEASGAWVEAGAHFVSAEQCVRSSADVHQAEDLLVEIEEGIWRCSRVFDPVRAITALDDLMKYYRHKGLKEGEAFCIIRLINLYSQLGMFDKARECYENSLGIIPGHPVLVAAAQTAYAYTYTFLGRPLDALNLLEKARRSHTADPFLYAVNMLTTLAPASGKET